RGGQSLANVGHVVVVGDVNPGAELVAGGDILVFGALRGVAHAGAQGDRSARVYALVLEPTQLRIATTIAAGMERTGPHEPEEAFLDGERITIVAAGDVPHLRPIAENV
ncbi:MAG: septum site-determining protein MinC, partial [Vulcanimicrobiaceae bacterium]